MKLIWQQKEPGTKSSSVIAKGLWDKINFSQIVFQIYAPRRYPEKSFFILNLESVQLCPSPVLPHAISAQNCAEFEVKHKSNSSWTHSNPGTWKLVLILKWKTDWLVANISPTRTQLKSGTVCTVLLGTQFYAFQIQNQKRFLGKAAWGVNESARQMGFGHEIEW